MSSNTDADRIARGGQPRPWTHTATHPAHGELTFTATLPTSAQLIRHSVAMDNLLEDLDGEPRAATMIRVAAIAGLTPERDRPGKAIMLDLPVVAEHRTEDSQTGHVQVTRVFYDAAGDVHTDFAIGVWMAYSDWRLEQLAAVDAVKGSSGATAGPGSEESSIAPTGSPSTTSA